MDLQLIGASALCVFVTLQWLRTARKLNKLKQRRFDIAMGIKTLEDLRSSVGKDAFYQDVKKTLREVDSELDDRNYKRASELLEYFLDRWSEYLWTPKEKEVK